MFENPRRGRQARNFTTNVSKILDLKSSSEQINFRKLSLGAPVEGSGNSYVGRTEDIFTVEIPEGNFYEKERRKPVVNEPNY